MTGNPTGNPRVGAFEVTDDTGKGTDALWPPPSDFSLTVTIVYWSKLSGQGFPTDNQIVEVLRKGGFVPKA